MFGSHLSIAGAMTNALQDAERLKLDTVQIFTKSQQQWRVKPLADDAVEAWRGEIERLGWQGRTVVHASYLINLASPKDALWEKSIDLMEIEIDRCHTLGIPHLVHHPGAFTESTLDEGLDRIADAYKELFRRTPTHETVMCLENTAGSGTTIGRTFEELADLRQRILTRSERPDRVGYCIDTCHAHAAGYDMSSTRKSCAVLKELDTTCDLDNVRVMHLNDSKVPMGSRVDRHAHIGEGTIGVDGFGPVVRHERLRDLPKILETPKGETDKGTPHDTLNLRRLKRLMG